MKAYISPIFYRSKDFRPAYDRLREVRALVPQGTPFLACTATVNRSIREEAVRSLEMTGCILVCTSPDRPNIFYQVRARATIDVDVEPLVESLKLHKAKAPRVIVYCRSLNTCADLYAHFTTNLVPTRTSQLELLKSVITDCLLCFTPILHNISRNLF